MIGNDIVDLRLAQQESNWSRPRFLNKIFTIKEIEFINSATDRNVAVWMLWSWKESAYKIVARAKNKRFFTPKKFETILATSKFKDSPFPHFGQIRFENNVFYTKSVVTDKYIHTTAQVEKDEQRILMSCFFIEENSYLSQSQMVRHHLIGNYAEKTKLSVKELSIQKDKCSIPHLYFKNLKQPSIVSISHHGNYGAYAILPFPFHGFVIQNNSVNLKCSKYE